MATLKVEKSESRKKEFVSGGVFLAIIGLVVAPLFSIVIGGGMIVVGLIMALAGAFASE